MSKPSFTAFYTLLVTQTLSLIGSSMTSLALGIWIYEETGLASPLTLVAFFTFLPQIISAGVAGVFADRYDRRFVMAAADAGQAVGTLALLFSLLSGQFQLWHLYAVALWQASFSVFQQPAFQASVTMMIPDSHRDRANAAMVMTGPISGIIAPALAGILYAAIDIQGVIAVDMITFLIGMVVVLLVRIPRPERSVEAGDQQQSFWQQSLAGLRYVWARPSLLYLFMFTGSINFFLAGLGTIRPAYILARTDNNEVLLGTLLSLVSVGSLLSAGLMSTWGGFRPRVHNIFPMAALGGVALAFFGTRSDPISMGIGLFIFAMAPPMINTSIISILQVKIPPDIQGRVFAAIQQLSMIMMPLSYLFVGPLADRLFEPAAARGWLFEPLVGSGIGAGMGLMYVFGGLAVAIIALTFYRWPAVRHLERLIPDFAT